MRARFIGDPRNNGEGASALSFAGVEFIKDQWAPVSASLAKKLKGNDHFELDADHDGVADPSVDELRGQLDDLGVKYHHKAGVEKLTALLDEATKA